MPKDRAKDTAKTRRRRASASFSPSDDLDVALVAAAGRHVGEAVARQQRDMNLDELVWRAIRAANAVDHDLSPAAFAKVVTAMLADLVASGIVDGVLPSDARLAAIVSRHIKTDGIAVVRGNDPIGSHSLD